MNSISLKNVIQITKLPTKKTQSIFFKDVKVGDVIEIQFDLNSKLKAVDLKNLRTSKKRTSLVWDVMRTLQTMEYIQIK